MLAAFSGDTAQAVDFFQRSLAMHQEHGNVEGQVIVYNNLGILQRDQGDLAQAEAFFHQGIGFASSYHMGYQLANTRLGLALALNMAGRTDEAMDLVRSCQAQAAALGAKDVATEAQLVRAEIYLTLERWQDARQAGLAAAAQAKEIGNYAMQSAAWRTVSESERHMGNLAAAEQACLAAVQAVADINEQLETGRVVVQQARVAKAQGDDQAAAAHLLKARHIFEAIRASMDLERVDALLNEIKPDPHIKPDPIVGENSRRP